MQAAPVAEAAICHLVDDLQSIVAWRLAASRVANGRSDAERSQTIARIIAAPDGGGRRTSLHVLEHSPAVANVVESS